MEVCSYCGHSPVDNLPICPVCGASQSPQHLPAGHRLNGGRYAVGKMLGQGGFGMTYLGSDTVLARPVAVKELFPEGSIRQNATFMPPASLGTRGFADIRDRFLDEARTMAQFNNPGIVRVLDVFQENGTAYLVMEYLEGLTLAGRIQKEGALPPEEVLGLVLGLGNALAAVHTAGLLHRDIKPDNIFLTRDQRVVLIDFGSARGFAQGKTVRHTRLVTPGYAPLEQYATEAKFGPYTDIYALGATLYHALTGTQPPAPTDRLMGTVLAPLPSTAPARLRNAVDRAMGVRVDERPQTIAEFLALLGDAAADEAAASAQPRVPERPLAPERPTAPPEPKPQAPPESKPNPPSGGSAPSGSQLSFDVIRSTCLAYSSKDYFAGNIPSDRLAHARATYPIPMSERVAALIDTTVFGSAKTGLAITEEGLRWHNDWTSNSRETFVRWDDLAKAEIGRHGKYEIVIGEGNLFNMSACNFDKETMVLLLKDLQAEVRQCSSQPSSRAPAGPSQPPAPAPASESWMVAVNGQQFGPYDLAQIKSLLISGQVNPYGAHAWTAGMPDWKPFLQVPSLAALLVDDRKRTIEAAVPDAFQTVPNQSFFVHPHIPADKLSNFIQALRRKTQIPLNPDDVIAYFDDTVGGSGKSGVAVTWEGVYALVSFSKQHYCPFQQMRGQATCSGVINRDVVIDGPVRMEMTLTQGNAGAEALVRLINFVRGKWAKG